VLKRFSVDSFRYFLVREAPYGNDVTFSEEAVATRQNSDLADTFGNLVHRALALCGAYCGGKVPEAKAEAIPDFDIVAIREASERHYARLELQQAMEVVVRGLFAANKYVNDEEPWKMKKDDPRRLAVVRTILEVIYAACHFLAPVLVGAAATVFSRLGTPPRPIRELRPTLDHLTPGTQTATGDVLFEKVKLGAEELEAKAKAAEEAAAKKAAETKQKAAASAGTDLSKCRFCVGKVLSAKPAAGAATLYIEEIDVGEGAPRQVVSGLAGKVPLEELTGKLVVLLANIKASNFKGHQSQAMLLCATSADGATTELVEPPAGSAVGERVVVAGHEAPPMPELNLGKKDKKIWEAVQKDLNTSGGQVAQWKETALATSKGPCTVKSIAGGTIK